LSENALKLTNGYVEFQNVPGDDPGLAASRGGKGREGKVEERRGVGRGRGGREGLKEREGKRRKWKREGRGIWTLRCSRQIDATDWKLDSAQSTPFYRITTCNFVRW
jgi:hypothetical protein